MSKRPVGMNFYIAVCVAFGLQENGLVVMTFYMVASSDEEAETKVKKSIAEQMPSAAYHRHEHFIERIPESDIEEIMQCVRPPILTDHVNNGHEIPVRRGRSLVV